jgi:hypothetical protein
LHSNAPLIAKSGVSSCTHVQLHFTAAERIKQIVV